jgi:hypothetical protein
VGNDGDGVGGAGELVVIGAGDLVVRAGEATLGWAALLDRTGGFKSSLALDLPASILSESGSLELEPE